MRSRVVITGIGVCSPIGSSAAAVLQSFEQGSSGIAAVRSFDASDFTMKHAAEIPDFDPYQYLTSEEVLVVDRATQLAIAAAEQALADARIDLRTFPAERVAIAVGMSGAGQFQNIRFTLDRRYKISKEAAFYTARGLPLFQAQYLAQRFGIHGPQSTFATASAGSGIAIGWAMEQLWSGKVDLVLAGGAEGFTLVSALGMDSLGVSSSQPCSPFSGSPGITFGEAAAYFVLEPLEQARDRGATALAELVGYGVSIDGYDAISNDPSGAGLLRAMQIALHKAGMSTAQIDWIRGSGTGNRDQDLSETLAVKQLYRGAVTPPLSGLEGHYGHANGAAPALGLASAVLCQRAGLIPPTLRFDTPRPGCDLDYVPNQPRRSRVTSFLANSMAFGGVNVALVAGEIVPHRSIPDHPRQDVVITGVGIVSALGIGLDEFVEGMRQGRSGIGDVDRFDISLCRARRAGLVRGLELRRHLPSGDLRRSDRVNQYAAVAADLALKDAALQDGRIPASRLGLVSALTRGPESAYARFWEEFVRNPRSPATGRLLLRSGRFFVTSQTAQVVGIKGLSATCCAGITAGLHALIYAFEVLRHDDAHDAVVVLAADEVAEVVYRLSDCEGWLATSEGHGGETLKPYDPQAEGMVLGEGAVGIVLERQHSARARGARTYAQVSGYGLTADATNYGELEPEGRWLGRAMELALAEAGIGASDVDVGYGHGRGLPVYDRREARAWARLLGDQEVPVCCVMGNTGVAEAASGLYSTAAAALGLSRGEAYPVVTSGTLPGPLCWVRDAVRRGDYRSALVAGSTEYGNNAAVVLTAAGVS